MVRAFQMNSRSSKRPELGERLKAFGEKRFSCDVANLVALLVLNDRKSEAEEIAQMGKKEWDSSAFHDLLDRSLKGEVPPAFP
jgi:hypothetical protein